ISEALPQERWQRERGIIQNEQAPKLSSHEAFEIEFRKFITLLENKGIKVVLLGQAPPLNRHPNYQITLADKFKEKVFKAPTPKFENTDLLLNPKILDRLNFETNLYEELSESSSVYHLKTRNYIPKPITSDGVLLYRDDDHLNQSGALILAPALNQLLE
ncbi:MAG: SGNH hydrolase domain-containing protein, partial [Verrucomicrobiota bacterium]